MSSFYSCIKYVYLAVCIVYCYLVFTFCLLIVGCKRGATSPFCIIIWQNKCDLLSEAAVEFISPIHSSQVKFEHCEKQNLLLEMESGYIWTLLTRCWTSCVPNDSDDCMVWRWLVTDFCGSSRLYLGCFKHFRLIDIYCIFPCIRPQILGSSLYRYP